jgi:CRP-like cAMP-binding protein
LAEPAAAPALAAVASPIGAAVRRDGTRRRFARGQALFVEGDRSGPVFLIERGWVLIYCTAPAGRDAVLGVRGPGEILGDLSALDDKPRNASAVALVEVEAVVAPGSTLTRVLANVDAAHELIAVLAHRLREADRTRLELTTLDTLGVVAGRLLELADRFGRTAPEGVVVELALSQEQLASWCGASREATVKALRSLRSLGCISTARRVVVVHDMDALRRHSVA